MEEVLRCTSFAPLASPCFVLCVIWVETEGFLDHQGRAGIISIVRWNLRPVIFGVDRQVRKNSLNIKFLGGIFLGHPGPRRRDIPEKTLCFRPFSVVFDKEWLGCPGIWVGTSRTWKKFMQENFGLIFRYLNKRKTHERFSDGVPGTKPTLPRNTRDKTAILLCN